MITAWLDTETFSGKNVRTYGTDQHTSDPLFYIQMYQYAIEDGPVHVWVPTMDPELLAVTDIRVRTLQNQAQWQHTLRNGIETIEADIGCQVHISASMPTELKQILFDDTYLIKTHNVRFDRTAINRNLNIDIPVERWHCTMTQAMAHGFPGSLDKLCTIFGIQEDQAKNKEGSQLIQRFCGPAPKNHKAAWYTYRTHPGEYVRFIKYGVMDVIAMRTVGELLPDWAFGEMPEEREWYSNIERMNDEGVRIDTALGEAAVELDQEEKASLFLRCAKLTNGKVDRPTRKNFREYLVEQFDIELPDVKGSTIQPLLDGNTLDPVARELLELKLAAAKTSVGKYKKINQATGDDGRLRHIILMNGAPRTGRQAAKVAQVHNMPSRGIPKNPLLETFVEAIKAGDMEAACPKDEIHKYLSGAIRYTIIPDEGNCFLDSDWSSIEGVLAAWYANETWKLDAYREIFSGVGADMYMRTAAAILGIEPEAVTKAMRTNYGKPAELGLGYQGGVGAFVTFANVYGVDLDELQVSVLENMDPNIVNQAENHWNKWGRKRANGMDSKTWIACEAIKIQWRNSNPAITQLWYDLDNAVRSAIHKPNKLIAINDKLSCKVIDYGGVPVLLMALASGRILTYWNIHLRYGADDDDKGTIAYYGVDNDPKSPRKGQWTYLTSFGGKFLENICQATGRDLLRDLHNRLVRDRFPADMRLQVHDQVLLECPIGEAEKLKPLLTAQMKIRPTWGPDIPLNADTEIVPTFRKT